jgi:hypothetical protein
MTMAAPEKGPGAVTPETLGRVAAELVGTPLSDKDRAAVADLLQGLWADTAAVRGMDLGEAEPALVYNPAEGEP